MSDVICITCQLLWRNFFPSRIYIPTCRQIPSSPFYTNSPGCSYPRILLLPLDNSPLLSRMLLVRLPNPTTILLGLLAATWWTLPTFTSAHSSSQYFHLILLRKMWMRTKMALPLVSVLSFGPVVLPLQNRAVRTLYAR